MEDLRKEQLQYWISEQTHQACELVSLTGDAGFRKYYRFSVNDKNYIAVDSSLELENNRLFIELSKAYDKAEILVPVIHGFDLDNGFLWLSDLGQCHLYDLIQENGFGSFDAYHRS